MGHAAFVASAGAGAADPPGAGGAAADEAGAAAPAAGPACAKAGGTARAANIIAATMKIVAVSRARMTDEATALHGRAVTKTVSRLFERLHETRTGRLGSRRSSGRRSGGTLGARGVGVGLGWSRRSPRLRGSPEIDLVR